MSVFKSDSTRKSNHLRIVLFAVALLSMCLGVYGSNIPGTDTNPFVKLGHEMKDGTVRITLKNISKKPIVAFVVALDDGTQATTHHKYYGGRNLFEPGKTVELVFAVQSASSTPRVFLDYVRLTDSSTWGNAVTDAGKDVAASFEK